MSKMNLCITVLALISLAPWAVFGWGIATHVYFGDHLGKGPGFWNYQEMYGATVPDLYKSVFGTPYYDYLESETHIQFDKVVRKAFGSTLNSFALGFASHNDVWGADFTSHHAGRTTPGIGYISAQVETLKIVFQDSIEQVLVKSNIDPEQAKTIAVEFAPSVAHIASELAVDILIKRNEDGNIGRKMLLAAQLRSSAIPGLLVAAYAEDFAREFDLNVVTASGILLSAEQAHRTLMTTYAGILLQSEAEIVHQLASYLSNLAELYLKITKGLDVSIPSATAVRLLKFTLNHVERSYAAEIAATLAYLKAEMPKHPNTGQELAVEQMPHIQAERDNASLPERFSLEQNWPNPFNPTTQIRYALPTPSSVKLLVFNTIGQIVATLIDTYQDAGVYQITWDASGMPGGVYIYRLETDSYRVSRKMVFQK